MSCFSYTFMTQTTDRNTTIDILKGVAIILVIFAHCIQFGSGSNYLESLSFFDNQIFKFIYSFHMPLFMLISGYLFYFTIQKHQFKYILKSRLKRLLIPIIIWQTIWILLFDYNNPNNYNGLYIFNSYLNTLWFLTSLLINSLIVLFGNKYAKDSFLLYSTIIIISLFIPNYFGYNLYVFMLPYFLCGYFYNKISAIRFSINRINEKIAFFLFIIIFSILLWHYELEDYAYISGTFIIRKHMISISQFVIDIFRWSIGLIGSISVILLFRIIYKRNKNSSILRWLGTIGTKTMGLYIISSYLFNFFQLIPITNFNYIYIMIEFSFVTLISYLLTYLIEQNKYTKSYLLGGH